jgi:hypothetical protein
MFERVHTCTDWYDGPRGGIADYQGRPHVFVSEWTDIGGPDRDTFLLSPVDAETYRLAVEDWAIWLRWEAAFHQGRVTVQTHPALPEESARHEELQHLLQGRLVVDNQRALRKAAMFRVREDPSWSGLGFRPLEVRWDEVNLDAQGQS